MGLLSLLLSPVAIRAQTLDEPATNIPIPSSAPLSDDVNASSASPGIHDQLATLRTAKAGDYIASAIGLALVLSAKSSPSRSFERAVIGDQQYSVISPFPGGGYTVLPTGQFRPGGALAVNIPIAYAPNVLDGSISLDVAQNRTYQSLRTENGRNGTATAGIGFGIKQRPVWLSAMLLSGHSDSGGLVYNAMVQLAPEKPTFPAIAVGVQDVFNRYERSPFIVATRQLEAPRPMYFTVGAGKGRFSDSTVFAGLSYSPVDRVTLEGEYDGLQFNVGLGVAATNRLSLLASYNDLRKQNDRPAGQLGQRYQFGATYGF